ncbi:MAG: ArdC family protein [Candidatus Melainabacteria bacterium]
MTDKPKRDLYQEITDKIVVSLEQGVRPWKCPWDQARYGGFEGIPYNVKTGYSYRGINIPILWATQQEKSYQANAWLSYKQAEALGGNIRKGEKSTTVVYWNFLDKEEDGKHKRIPFLKWYNVFNLDQCEGIESKPVIKREQTWEDIQRIEGIIQANKVDLRFESLGVRACYSPSFDFINMPKKERFKIGGDYYCTLFHEMTHWTGHHSRLEREFKGRFGDESYAFEELIAEMGSAFLFADLGLEGNVQHDSYIASWLRVLKNDKKAIFKAATEASKAHQFILKAAGELEEPEALEEAA